MSIPGKALAIRVADIIIRIDSAICIERFNDIGFYKNFITKNTGYCNCRLNIKIEIPPRLPSRSGAFSPRGNWQLFGGRDRKVLEMGPPPKRGGPENL